LSLDTCRPTTCPMPPAARDTFHTYEPDTDNATAVVGRFAHDKPFSGCVLGSLQRLLPDHSPTKRLLAIELAADLVKNGRGGSVAKLRKANIDQRAVDDLMAHVPVSSPRPYGNADTGICRDPGRDEEATTSCYVSHHGLQVGAHLRWRPPARPEPVAPRAWTADNIQLTRVGVGCETPRSSTASCCRSARLSRASSRCLLKVDLMARNSTRRCSIVTSE